MKRKFSSLLKAGLVTIAAAIAAGAVGFAAAARQGSFVVSVAWDAYTDTNAVALRLNQISQVGTNAAQTNYYMVTNLTQTQLTIPVVPGSTNRLSLTAVGLYGLESDPSNELTYKAPNLPIIPTSPGEPKIGAVIYLP